MRSLLITCLASSLLAASVSAQGIDFRRPPLIGPGSPDPHQPVQPAPPATPPVPLKLPPSTTPDAPLMVHLQRPSSKKKNVVIGALIGGGAGTVVGMVRERNGNELFPLSEMVAAAAIGAFFGGCVGALVR